MEGGQGRGKKDGGGKGGEGRGGRRAALGGRWRMRGVQVRGCGPGRVVVGWGCLDPAGRGGGEVGAADKAAVAEGDQHEGRVRGELRRYPGLQRGEHGLAVAGKEPHAW